MPSAVRAPEPEPLRRLPCLHDSPSGKRVEAAREDAETAVLRCVAALARPIVRGSVIIDLQQGKLFRRCTNTHEKAECDVRCTLLFRMRVGICAALTSSPFAGKLHSEKLHGAGACCGPCERCAHSKMSQASLSQGRRKGHLMSSMPHRLLAKITVLE